MRRILMRWHPPERPMTAPRFRRVGFFRTQVPTQTLPMLPVPARQTPEIHTVLVWTPTVHLAVCSRDHLFHSLEPGLSTTLARLLHNYKSPTPASNGALAQHHVCKVIDLIFNIVWMHRH